jgi:hypothetical protein
MPRRTVVGITSSVTRALVGSTSIERLHVYVACDDGTTWLWGPTTPQNKEQAVEQEKRLMFNEPVPHTWIQFHTPVPGTAADEE